MVAGTIVELATVEQQRRCLDKQIVVNTRRVDLESAPQQQALTELGDPVGFETDDAAAPIDDSTICNTCKRFLAHPEPETITSTHTVVARDNRCYCTQH